MVSQATKSPLTNARFHWCVKVKEGLLAAGLKKLGLKKLWDKQTVALTWFDLSNQRCLGCPDWGGIVAQLTDTITVADTKHPMLAVVVAPEAQGAKDGWSKVCHAASKRGQQVRQT